MMGNNTFRDPIPDVFLQVTDSALEEVGVIQPYSAEQIHALRVATKKLRALVQVYLPSNGKSAVKPVEREIKQLADSFASSRDAEVLYQTLCEVIKRHGDDSAKGYVKGIVKDSVKGSAQDIGKLLSIMAGRKDSSGQQPGAINLADTFNAIVMHSKGRLSLTDSAQLQKGLNHSLKRSVRLMNKAMKTGENRDYHSCRKWLKYRLYQLELLGDGKKAAKNTIHTLKKLTDSLGKRNDLSLLEHQLNEMAINTAPNEEELVKSIQQVQEWLRLELRKNKKLCHLLFKKLA